MKNHSMFFSLVFLPLVAVLGWSATPAPRQRLLMDYHWQFILSDEKDAQNQNFDDTKWRTLNLPHDWSIEGEFTQDAPTTGLGIAIDQPNNIGPASIVGCAV
jgi:beta-galactosidase